MQSYGNIGNLLIKHCNKYPLLQIRDIFKFLYQSTFGCEHMISSDDNVLIYIKNEFELSASTTPAECDLLSDEFSRVGLSYLKRGISPETLAKLFVLSSKKNMGTKEELESKIRTAAELVKDEVLPFSENDFQNSLALWKEAGYPPVHHSDAFKASYNPSYRVISNDFIPFLPLFAEIDKRLKNGRLRVALDGRSASGKSTLSKLLEEIYGCTVFHMDDFFLRPEQRTDERFAQIGGNIDHERFLEDVLLPLNEGKNINYRRFDCSEMKLLSPVSIIPSDLIVTEGVYSMHPEMAEYYDFSVFLEISPDLQKSRILKRNSPEIAKRFFDEWIPLENRYFEYEKIKDKCDIVIEIK